MEERSLPQFKYESEWNGKNGSTHHYRVSPFFQAEKDGEQECGVASP